MAFPETLPELGDISMSQVNTVLGRSATNQISLDDSEVRMLFEAGASGTEISMRNGYGKSLIAGATWTQRTSAGNELWLVLASNSDGTKLVAAASLAGPGYLYTSTDSGATWTKRFVTSAINIPWNSLASSSDGTKLVATTEYETENSHNYLGSLYTSTDSGVTWTRQPNAARQGWRSVACSSDGTKLVATNGYYLWTSSDSGVTWTRGKYAGNDPIITGASVRWEQVASNSDGTKLIAVISHGNVYTSTDSGVNWTAQINSGINYWAGATINSDGTKMVAWLRSGSGGFIYTSSDSGFTWYQRTGTGTSIGNKGWCNVVCSSDGKKLATASFGDYNLNKGYIYTSIDGGVTWVERTGAGQFQWKTIVGNSTLSKLFVADTGIYPLHGWIYSSP